MTEATPIKGRCGTCDWPTDSLPCPYCAAVAREHREHVLSGDCWCGPEVIVVPGREKIR